MVFALWTQAVVDGRTSPDAAADAIAAGATHRVLGLLDDEAVSLPVALARLRAVGSHAYSDVNAGTIVARIMRGRDMYEERQRAKGLKGSVEAAVKRREELETEQRERMGV